MRNVIIFLVVIACCAGGYYFWQHHKTEQALNDGAVTCEGCLPPKQEAAYVRYDHGDGSKPKTDSVASTPQSPDPSGFPAAQPASNNVATPVVVPEGNTAVGSSTPGTQVDSNSNLSRRPIGPETPAANPPTADTVAANPANGQRFGGSGSYQWYRQGDLTWRVNTATGSSCIVYATMEQWRKRIVMAHGCGSNA